MPLTADHIPAAARGASQTRITTSIVVPIASMGVALRASDGWTQFTFQATLSLAPPRPAGRWLGRGRGTRDKRLP